ncbi:MAG TPA: hypothetical protein VE684_16830, partial [Crenalkalicoccus sp.]|nr:hypothetical protein [Crenalkalicoccus sp.]
VTGGSGYDALILRTTPDHATVTQEQDGSVIVVLQGAVIRATGIERVEFSDGTLAVNTGGTPSPTDWNTLAAIAEDNWLATGHWFV